MWRNTRCLLKVIYSLVSKVQKSVFNILYFRKFLRDIKKAQKNFFHFKRLINFVQDLQYLQKSSVNKLCLQELIPLSLGREAVNLVADF